MPHTAQFRFASISITDDSVDRILSAVSKRILDGLGEHVDLALVFPSSHFVKHAAEMGVNLRRAIGARAMIGCCAEGVIGPDHEIENEPAVAVVAARLPGVDIRPFHIAGHDLMDLARAPSRLDDYLDIARDTRGFVMVADPFSSPMERVLGSFNTLCEGVPIIGGLASAARQPGENRLFMNDAVHKDGLVGVGLGGAVQIDVIVSQGCRPVGPVFEVTGAVNNIIDSLGGQSPMERIGAVLEGLDESDRDLLRNGLFIGRAIDPSRESLGRGDFLIRGVLGADSKTGAIAVGDIIENGERVQFHLRDARTAREDLEMMLTPHALFGAPSGAFLFSCNGRGTNLYSEPDGDISAITSFFRGIDLAGFFCAGEIGPIGGKNFLHGHTASLALIRPAGRELQ
ncbi:MAG TPA: FIST N-terminal domain-containing protein [Candidatus Krumholzibacteria bacterium]